MASLSIAAAVHGSNASGASAFHPGPCSAGSLAVDPTQPGVVYVGSGAGVFESVDGAATWSNLSGGIGDHVVLDIVLDPRRARVVYVATNAGLFKSTNGGESWIRQFARTDVVRVAVDPSNTKIVYAGAMREVFKSSDGGLTWHRVLSFRRGQWTLALTIVAKHPGTVFAGTGAGVFKTMDGGRHWRAMNRGVPTPNGRDRVEGFVRAVAIDQRDPRTVYLGTERGFFRTTNGGERWVRTSGAVDPPGVWALAIDPRNSRVVYAGSYDGVYKSTNGGRSWRFQSTGLSQRYGGKQPWVEALTVDPSSPRIVYAGGADGVFKSIDAAHEWQPASRFNPSTPCHSRKL